MLGTPSATLFSVFADPGREREPELHHWYDVVHGPDALANGSFDALNRYRAVGPGWHEAPLLALWEGRYRRDAEAWDYIRPRAASLQRQGRIGDIPSAVYALMLFHTGLVHVGSADRTVRSLTTVQNDWREPDPSMPATSWFELSGLGALLGPDLDLTGSCLLYSSDPEGPAPGRHLAVIESPLDPDGARTAWQALGVPGEPGMSPTPEFRSAFEDGGHIHGPDATDQPAPQQAWVMHWEPIARLG